MDTVNNIFDHEAFAKALTGSVASNARKIGVSRGHLLNIIRGRRTPSGQLMLKIQTVFDLRVSQITKKV